MASDNTVLVVEDDDSMRQAIERLLWAAGFKPACYISAECLLAGDSITDAVCIISDFKLPAMSGLELLTELRARGALQPMIVITAHDTTDLRDEVVRRGATYLAKPFLGAALLAAINNVR